MTDAELADEIERHMSHRPFGFIIPLYPLYEADAKHVIAALRRQHENNIRRANESLNGPERQPSSDQVLVPRDVLRRIQNECRDVVSFQVAIHNLLTAAEAEGGKT